MSSPKEPNLSEIPTGSIPFVPDRNSAPTNLYEMADVPSPVKSPGPTPPVIRPLEVGSVLTGRADHKPPARYQLVQPLGQGGFGQVWKAQTLPGSPSTIPAEVAIKVFAVPNGLTQNELKNRELSAMLAVHELKTDRVPRIFDWAIGGEWEFVVMEFCGHGSLHELRYRNNLIDEPTAWRLLTDLLTAIQHAHSADILHLDVKPANVLLDGKGGFMLTDFGISQGNFVNSSIQYPGLGTPHYRAPEQEKIDETQIGSRTDLYGIGSTVWSAFCGFDLSSKRCPELRLPEPHHTVLPSARTFREQASVELCEILDLLLARDPANRPGGAAEVLALIAEKREHRTSSVTALVRRVRFDGDAEVEELLDSMIDPLWQVLLRERADELRFARYDDGEYLCIKDEKSYTAYLLLSGRLAIEIDGAVVAEESREGTFIGEISTLTGGRRTASVRCDRPVWVCVFNAAELERFAMCNPAVAIRMIRSLAKRVASHADARDRLAQSKPR